ncbi:hypothetical protein JY651_02315 [Pyxidicoccus parkwayensis]|uniref:Uncharacterized protein n=1 Tax=Pyxidicoccus parkwayensis TaxID=2813578 RepID=A0ABX7NYG6_9BACT|nr:hypothetical protein [Pyxidicoccus parkwaysis]QSQ23840.1 hypothetical protein JY651_02315 [Pyxidicoccus parkwaysis]
MSFTSRLEGLLHQVGLGGVVGEVRSRLGLSREPASPRNEAVAHAPPPRAPAYAPAPAQTVVERTPRPRPVAEPVAPPESVVPRASSEAEAPAASKPARAAKSAKAKKPRAAKSAKKAPAHDGAEASASKARKGAASKGRAKAKKSARNGTESAAPQDASAVVARLVEALKAHPRHEALVSAGKQKDQLVRSLIPLYLARSVDADVEVTSGTMSRFWGELGVTYAAPNAAKALRLHSGYAQDTKKGKAITPRGIQYVEEALKRAGGPA